jgi:Putative metal-binding motif
MKRHLLRALLLLVLLLSGLTLPRPAVGQQQPIWVSPQELYRFLISPSDLGYSLSALYQESLRDGFYYNGIVGSIYRPPAGYTPDPASGLVPLHRWIIVEGGWRVYTHHTTYPLTPPSNYTYGGILGYVFPPTTTSHTFDSGVTASLTQMSMWYSQSYGVFNGRGAPGYGSYEFPPNSSFAYQGVIAAMPPPVGGTRPDRCTEYGPFYYCPPFNTSYDVRFNPPPDNDGDGYYTSQDCNDSDSSIYPGAPMYCEAGLDRNCNGTDDWNECYYQEPCYDYMYCPAY